MGVVVICVNEFSFFIVINVCSDYFCFVKGINGWEIRLGKDSIWLSI